MNKKLLVGLSTATLISMISMTAFAEDPIKTTDGLLEITLPAENWYQINSDENTEMFSDGDCAILVNLYKNGETLPAIESADANHELIYTAAASTQDYILHVVGYADHKSDFSGICKAINSIKVDDTKIVDSMLNHVVAVEQYGIADMNYSAWVDADELNVRSTSEDGSIIAKLVLGDKVTVTGSVLKDNTEIGWSRIKMADGTEGYVSAQFLSVLPIGSEDTAPETDQNAEKTTATVTLYDGTTPCTLHVYTDGSVRTDDGQIFWQIRYGVYTDYNGHTLYLGATATNPAGHYRTGNVLTVYHGNGSPFTIYEYSDGIYYDDAMNSYEAVKSGSDTMLANGGAWEVYLYNPTGMETYQEFTDFSIKDVYGNIIAIDKMSEMTGVYYDYNGNAYAWDNNLGAYTDDYGNTYYNLDTTVYSDDSEMDYDTALPIAVTNGSGAVKYIVYDYDAGCYVDSEGNEYYRTGPSGTYVDGYGTDWSEDFAAYAPQN